MADATLAEIAVLAASLARTTKKLEKRRIIADLLRGLSRAEMAPVVLLLSGRIFPESSNQVLNIGYAALQKAASSNHPPRPSGPVALLEAYRRLTEIAQV